jgi:hypothetical protein
MHEEWLLCQYMSSAWQWSRAALIRLESHRRVVGLKHGSRQPNQCQAPRPLTWCALVRSQVYSCPKVIMIRPGHFQQHNWEEKPNEWGRPEPLHVALLQNVKGAWGWETRPGRVGGKQESYGGFHRKQLPSSFVAILSIAGLDSDLCEGKCGKELNAKLGGTMEFASWDVPLHY